MNFCFHFLNWPRVSYLTKISYPLSRSESVSCLNALHKVECYVAESTFGLLLT